MIKVARTHISTRKKCEMKRFLSTEVLGTGVEPIEGEWIADSALGRTRGLLIHECAELQWKGEDWESHLQKRCDELFDPQFRNIHLTSIRRAFKGWLVVRWPYYQQNFTLMSAEQEWLWELMPGVLGQPLRMDKIVRRIDDGMLGIVDFKTMKSPDLNWIYRMKNDDQTHLYIQALKEKSNEPTMGIAYEGLCFGEWKEGELRSPLVMGYRSKATGKISPKYSAGTDRVSIIEYSDEKWLEWAQKAEILEELYPTTGFLLPTSQNLLHTKTATTVAELKWYDRMEQLREVETKLGMDSEEYQMLFSTIEKNSDNCLKFGWGHKCPYVQVCWEGMGLDGFRPRVDHHTIEGDD
jgi:hypothetical protein